eukprot:TRINITY_DN26847_c0_g5_i1.p1 TRINITY_DN26847_c0_g5~~TRINITY_DN26847_c0_g5_i1.p1  ORF type:complete len:1564 (+),score=258.53 TRINITY_DN26847_c0_g5_i1:102-4694(+)
MDWVAEREDWLLDWSHARCLGEITFGDASPWPGAADADDTQDAYFSDVIEAGGRCLAARARGTVVDVFDISPDAAGLTSWRIRLPAAVVPDVGISHTRVPHSDVVALVLLTKSNVVHCAHVILRGPLLEVVAESSTTVSLPAAPSAFFALDADVVAVGCANGALQVARLRQGYTGSSASSYELTDATLLRRLYGGLGYGSAPPVLALAGVGTSGGGLGSRQTYHLLSFATDGQLRLWNAQERGGQLATSVSVLASEQSISLVGSSSAYLRVSSSKTRACLILRSAIYAIDIVPASLGRAAKLSVVEIQAPFSGAVPSIAAVSQNNLWGFWSNHAREQLFRVDLETPDALSLRHAALDACNIGSGAGDSPSPSGAHCHLAMEGCTGTSDTASRMARAVFSLHQQHDVWRAEEDGFDAIHLAEILEGEMRHGGGGLAEHMSSGATIEDRALSWWVARVFLPGRFSSSIVSAALREVGGYATEDRSSWSLAASGHGGEISVVGLQSLVEAHIKKRALGEKGGAALATHTPYPAGSPLHAASSVAVASSEFLRVCDGIWRRRHQVCSIAASSAWAPHTRLASGAASADVTPLLLCQGGVSCIRAVHNWSERWWATLHMTRDLSNYENLDIESVLRLSSSVEWKVCTTAWFLSQCVGNANVNMTLSVLGQLSLPSLAFRRFTKDVPKHLVAHLSQCVQQICSPELASHLQTVHDLFAAMLAPEERSFRVEDKTLNTLRGTWSSQDPAAGRLAGQGIGSRSTTKHLLSDVLRGGIVLGECEFLCASMRDLLLLGVYIGSSEPEASIREAWSPLAQMLDESLPRSLSLRQSLLQYCPETSHGIGIVGAAGGGAGSPLRVGELWASSYRCEVSGGAKIVGVRVPLCSVESFQYATLLLRHECWDALRSWSKQQGMREFVAYVAAREWLACRRYDEARETFVHAEGCAAVVEECESQGMPYLSTAANPVIAYNARVAALFGARGRHQDEYFFTRRAALAAEEMGEGERSLQQQLWSSAFEQAIQLELWEEACDALVRVDAFQSHVRLLGQRLRSSGNIALVMRLPEKHRSFSLTSLHESASMSTPTVGSDSLACYNMLYALHFSGGEYLKAAAVAHMLYAALGEAMRSILPTDVDAPDQTALNVPALESGDCVSDLRDVPRARHAKKKGDDDSMVCDQPHAFSAYAKALDNVWPMLEQQRGALLMLVSALSLAPEKLLVVPPAHASLTPQDASADQSTPDMEDLDQLRSWFAEAEVKAPSMVVTVADVEKLLAVIEAQMVMAGRSDLSSSADLAYCVAALGLLGLALRICSSDGLDLWKFAFQPFVKLCLAADGEPDDKVAALADAARGPSQTYMFARSDGCEPLGCNGSVRAGFWQTLQQSLVQVSNPSSGRASGLSSDTARLHSLVAGEVLASGAELPAFVQDAMSEGSAWIRLLRLYMKYNRASDAVDLLERQLKRCGPPSVAAMAASEKIWSPLQDFPAPLVVQLRTWLAQQSDSRRSDSANGKSLEKLEALIAKYRDLLAERRDESRTAACRGA